VLSTAGGTELVGGARRPGDRPWDPPTLFGVGTTLALLALLASYLPARRVVSVDPIVALRAE
jgi:hypothetical protein